MSSPSADPRFDRAEISRILQRAAELQGTDSNLTADSLSLPELEQIAAEAGIDPRYVREAIKVPEQRSSARARLSGPKASVSDEFALPGSFPDASAEALLVAARSAFEQSGEVNHQPGSAIWTWTAEFSFTEVTLTRLRTGFWVQVTTNQSLDKAIEFIWLPLVGLSLGTLTGLFGMIVTPDALDAVPVVVGIAGGFATGVRLARQRWQRKIEAAAARVRELKRRMLEIARLESDPT